MGRYNCEQKYSLMDVTPVMAKAWLEKNAGNRKVNQRNVDILTKDILADDWDTTHQGIAIAADGTIVDGQHRLLAIVKANKSVKMWVLQNASKSTHIDSGIKRSESNRLQMGSDGLSWVTGRALAPINLLKYLYPKLELEQTYAKDAWMRRNEDIIRSCLKMARRSPIPRLNNAGILAGYIVAMMNGVPEAYLKTFAEVLMSGYANSAAENYAIALRNDLLGYRHSLSGDTWRKFTYERTCNRINQFYLAATGRVEPKRLTPGHIPYNIWDASGNLCYHKGKYVER